MSYHTRQAVLSVIAGRPLPTTAEIAAAVYVAPVSALYHLRALEDLGQIHRVRRGHVTCWALAEQAEAAA